jgi:hypothetical protein
MKKEGWKEGSKEAGKIGKGEGRRGKTVGQWSVGQWGRTFKDGHWGESERTVIGRALKSGLRAAGVNCQLLMKREGETKIVSNSNFVFFK